MTFSMFFLIFNLLVEENQKNTFFSRQYLFSLKLHKLPIFILLSLFYDNFFYVKLHKWPFFQFFFGDLLLFKENHLFYEKKKILHQKSLFFNHFLLISMFWLKTRNKHCIHFLSLKLYKVSIFNIFWTFYGNLHRKSIL